MRTFGQRLSRRVIVLPERLDKATLGFIPTLSIAVYSVTDVTARVSAQVSPEGRGELTYPALRSLYNRMDGAFSNGTENVSWLLLRPSRTQLARGAGVLSEP